MTPELFTAAAVAGLVGVIVYVVTVWRCHK